MSWVDLVVIGVLLLSGLVGLARGFIREVLSLGVWVVALGVAAMHYKGLAESLVPYVDQPTARLGIAFVGVVVAVLVVGALVGALLGALVSKTGLGGTDRLLGLLFGVARGGVLVAMATFLVALTPVADDAWWKESKSIVRFQQAADWLLTRVPAEVQEQLKKV